MILAHRGVHREAPENTLAAFAAAAALGLPGVETDVRRTADGALVLFHDRHAPGGRPVASLTRAELTAAAGHEVPLLAEALSAFPGLFFDVDVKDPSAGRGAVDLLVASGRTGSAVLTSFRHDLIAELASTSSVPVGPIVSHRPEDPEGFVAGWRRRSVRFLAVAADVYDDGFASAASAAGGEVWVWGLRGREEHSVARARGAAVLVTDEPEHAQ